MDDGNVTNVTLSEIVSNICTLHTELANLRGDELRAEMNAYLSCAEPSLEAKKRAGKYAAAHITTEIWKLEAELQCMIERKFYILRLENVRQNAD